MCVDEIEKVVCRFYGRLEEAYTRPRKKAQRSKGSSLAESVCSRLSKNYLTGSHSKPNFPLAVVAY